jgi:hypothetical protein
MDPNLSVQLPKNKNLNFKLLIPVFLIILALLAGGSFLFLRSKSTDTPVTTIKRALSLPSPTPSKTTNNDPQLLLEKDITAIFTSPKYKLIVADVKQSGKETDEDKRYSLLVKAYQEMLQAYNETKDPKFKLAIQELRNYAVLYPQFKAAEMILPE